MAQRTGEQQQVIVRLQQAYDNAEAILRQADANAVVYADSGWRVKDLVAHIAAWETEMYRSLEAYLQGREYAVPGFTDDDTYNAQAYAETKDEPTEQIYARWKHLRESLIALVRQLTPEQLEGEMLYPWHQRGPAVNMFGSTVGHQNEHIAHIEAVAQPGGPRAAWMRRLEESIQADLDAIAGLDPDMVIYAESGWRLRDIIGHIVHWEAVTHRSYEAYHQGGGWSIPNYDLETFNHEGVRQGWDLPYEQQVADWQCVRARFVYLIRAFTNGQLAGEMQYPSGRRGTVVQLLSEVISHPREHIAEICELAGRPSPTEARAIASKREESDLNRQDARSPGT